MFDRQRYYINLLPDVQFESIRPDQVPDDEWQALWEVHATSFGEALKGTRAPEEISHYVGTPEDFKVNKLAPTAHGDFNPDQTYLNPRLFIARAGGRPVGLAYMADNVSGQHQRRKHLLHQDYRTVTEIAVLPEYQRRYMASIFWAGFIATTALGRQMTAYTRPAELPAGEAFAQAMIGEKFVTGESIKHPYDNDVAVMQKRYATSRRETRRWAAIKLTNPAVQIAAKQLLRSHPVAKFKRI